MKLTFGHIAFFISFFISTEVFSQSSNFELGKVEKFWCDNWLTEFTDSIRIITNDKKIDQSKRHCAFYKVKKTEYNFHCWTGSQGLETPTEWNKKMKIRFKGDIVFIRFGRRRLKCKISRVCKDEYLLLKLKQNKARVYTPFSSSSPDEDV